MISRARNPRGSLADFSAHGCAQRAHGRGNPNFHSWGCRGPSGGSYTRRLTRSPLRLGNRNPIRPSEALLCYESRGGPDDSSEQSRLRAPFGHTLTRTSALMVNQHTLISRARNPRGSLADFLRKDALREHTARGNPNFHSWGCRGPSRSNFC
jgi:hypothetical protein